MQPAKDSFYVTLRDRLAALNPGRTVVIDGVTRPAVIVAENQAVTAAPPLPEAFYLAWGAARPMKTLQGAPRPLFALECAIGYRTAGTQETSGVDRSRCLCALDCELLQICAPACAAKHDHTQTPCAALGSQVFWTSPLLEDVERVGGELRRQATLTVFFFPEVDLP